MLFYLSDTMIRRISLMVQRQTRDREFELLQLTQARLSAWVPRNVSRVQIQFSFSSPSVGLEVVWATQSHVSCKGIIDKLANVFFE